MIIKSNTPLSDNELRRVKAAFQSETEITVSAMERVADTFPYTDIYADKDILYIGKPPWDLTQEIILE
jgi:hypothetical protein